MNHSILDTSDFVDAIARIEEHPDRKDEFILLYTKEMVKRGAEEVRLSIETALMVHDWERLMKSLLMNMPNRLVLCYCPYLTTVP